MIELHLTATSPEELIATINGLATLGGARTTSPAPRDASIGKTDAPAKDELEEIAEAVPQSEAPVRQTRQRRPKATAEPAAPVEAEDTSDPQEDTSAASPASKASGDSFADQIKQANEEAAAEREEEAAPTLDVVQQAFAKACAPGGKMTMLQAQEMLKASFKTAAGEPVRRIAELQVKDYAAVLAKLEG